MSNITEQVDKQHDHCEFLLQPTGTHGDPTSLIHQNLKIRVETKYMRHNPMTQRRSFLGNTKDLSDPT